MKRARLINLKNIFNFQSNVDINLKLHLLNWIAIRDAIELD